MPQLLVFRSISSSKVESDTPVFQMSPFLPVIWIVNLFVLSENQSECKMKNPFPSVKHFSHFCCARLSSSRKRDLFCPWKLMF